MLCGAFNKMYRFIRISAFNMGLWSEESMVLTLFPSLEDLTYFNVFSQSMVI